MKSKITLLTTIVTLFLINLVLAVDITDTTFFSSVSNSTLYINGTGTVNEATVTDNNLTLDYPQTNGMRIDSINETYDGILVLTNLTLSEPYNDLRWDNGTIIRYTIDTQTITIPAGQYIEIGQYFTRQAEIDVCEGWTDGAETFISFFSIIVLLAVAGIILFFITGNGGEIDLTSIAFAILIAGITLSFGAVIIVQLSGC